MGDASLWFLGLDGLAVTPPLAEATGGGAGRWIVSVLAVLGALVLLLIVLVIAGFYWVKRKLRTFAKTLAAAVGGGVPPFRLELTRTDDPSWTDSAGVQAGSRAFEAAGFEDAGSYHSHVGVTIKGFVNPASGAAGAIYEHPQAGLFTDVVCSYADGRELTVTNGTSSGLAQPEWAEKVYLPGADAPTLIAEFTRRTDGQTLKPVRGAEFRKVFCHAYAREMDWHIARGGPSLEEIHAIAIAGGDDCDDDAAAQVQEQWRDAISIHHERALRDAFKRSGSLSAVEWDEQAERLHFLYDGGATHALRMTCLTILTDGKEDDDEHADADEVAYDRVKSELEALFDLHPPAAALLAANRLLPEDRRFARIGRVSANDIDAEVWLEPASRYTVDADDAD